MWRVLPFLLFVVGCTHIPQGRSAVDHVEIVGAHDVDEDKIKDKIATADTPKFLGLFRGIVYDYEIYDRHTVAYDLARIERYYRARGYYDAHARAGRIFPAGSKHVRVEILVEEGKPIHVHDVQFAVDGKLSPSDWVAMQRAVDHHLARGAILDEDEIGGAENEVHRRLEDLGYAKVTAAVRAEVDVVHHKATLRVDVRPAEKCVLGPLTIEGGGNLPLSTVRRVIDLQEGKPYRRLDLDRAQQRILDLGIVSSVEIKPDTDQAPYGSVPIRAILQPTKLRDLRLGGGFELDELKFDVHVRARWQDRNFLGNLRRFEIDLKPGLVLYPTRLSDLREPNQVLPEVHTRLELRQPAFLENRTTGFLRAEPNIWPVLIRSTYIPDEPVIGYRELKTAVGVERAFGKLNLTLSEQVQIENPFTYSGALDPSLQTMVISYVEAQTTIDLRNSPVHPRKGAWLSNDLQIAGLGGQARDVRVQPEVRGYVPIGDKFTIAGRATVGFLFPFNYQVGTDTRDVQLVFFRGFFSGGPSHNRGYPLRGIGPQGDVTFFNPIVNRCNQQASAEQCAVPLGGLSLWEASLEGRAQIKGPFEGVMFCDASDVASKELAIRPQRPHLSCGLGARYDTPVGPIRLDVAYRIPGAQVLDGSAVEFAPDLVKGVPIALQIGLGEAF